MNRRGFGFNVNPIWILIIVNVVIFLTSLFDRQNLIIERFALIPYLVREQPWTLLTYMFLHGSWSHIIFNMIALYFLGTFTIALVGETAFLTTYFIGGIVGGLFYWLFSIPPILGTSEFAAVVGASGAIFALGGFLMIMRPNTKVITFPIPIPMPLWIAILISFLLVAFVGNIAWQAHLGGLVYGLAIGYYYRQRERRGRFF